MRSSASTGSTYVSASPHSGIAVYLSLYPFIIISRGPLFIIHEIIQFERNAFRALQSRRSCAVAPPLLPADVCISRLLGQEESSSAAQSVCESANERIFGNPPGRFRNRLLFRCNQHSHLAVLFRSPFFFTSFAGKCAENMQRNICLFIDPL